MMKWNVCMIMVILLLGICAAADVRDVPFTGGAGMHVCAGEGAAA